MGTLKLETKQFRKTVAKQTAQKMKLEARLRPILKKFFRNINADIANRYELTERIGTFNQYKDELVGILKDHYRITKRRFMGEYEQKADDITNATNLLMTEYIDEHAPQQADYILDTTQKQANKSLMDILIESALIGIALSSAGIAKELQKTLNAKIDGRADTIALTETQSLAEKTKITESMVAAGDITAGNVPLQPKKKAIKTWHAILDGNERSTHHAANRQTKPVIEPYVIGSSLLMYPGDQRADIKEWINCRCVSLTRVEN